MALSDSLDAIGAVTELLQTQLQAVSKIGVEVGRPGAGGAQMGRRLNLFLYRVAFDPGLRNLPLDDGQQPPLWLVLHYLLTAYEDHESDTAKAHRVLGRGLSALQSMAVLHPAGSNLALAANPQALKITFDDADVELVSRLTQGGEERFRLSAAFQVRPVMVATGEPPDFAPLVKTVGFETLPPGPAVIPTLGGRLERVEPDVFAAGATLTLSGSDLDGYEQVRIGTQTFATVPAADGAKSVTVPAATTLSAGAYPVVLVRALDAAHRITSNALLVHMLPVVTGATPGPRSPASDATRLVGTFTVQGNRLGGLADDVLVAVVGDRGTAWMLDVPGTAAQTSLAVTVDDAHALEAGRYAVIVRVNGEQAVDTFVLDWT
jgi:hypothetical protein